MNNVLASMLSRYSPRNGEEKEHAIKEIIQEIALSGLAHGHFFDHAAFYGGTCLRLFYGLDRFSEDLDFALVTGDPSFSLQSYFPALKKEFASYGLDVNIESKAKASDSLVQSAFLKGNTLMLFATFFPSSEDARSIIPNQRIKVKFEIDVDNPAGASTEYQYRMLPSPYEIRVFDLPSLFAGKIHAILCRRYQQHVKGRDFYDYLFYISKGASVNLAYLENKLKNTGGVLRNDETLTLDRLKALLKARFLEVDYASAKKDVRNFIYDQESLLLWKSDLFISTIDALTAA